MLLGDIKGEFPIGKGACNPYQKSVDDSYDVYSTRSKRIILEDNIPAEEDMRQYFYKYTKFAAWIMHCWVILCFGLGIGVSNNTCAQDVAILKSADIGAYSEAIDAFKESLPSSFQVSLEYDIQGDMAKGQSLARRIRASDVDVVLAVGLKAALSAKLEILDIPVIMCLVLNPEKYDLPSSNMVGLSLTIPLEKHLIPLQRLAPQILRIGVLFDPQKTQGLKDQLEQDAKRLGLTLVAQEVHSEQDVSNAQKYLEDNVDAVFLLPDSTVLTEHTLDFLISSTMEANIPLIGFSAGLVQSGAVTGVYFNYGDLGRHAATLVPTLLKPTVSSNFGRMMPPDVVHRAINVKSARYLGLSLTPDILRDFDEHY